MNIRFLLRAKRWAARPPSEAMFKMVVGIIVFCVILFAIEKFIGWPDWLSADRIGRPRFVRN
ncbi:hypothetical protein [Loktanella sp. S4079]|uniref:hypothetical protein n=1 Tax=Loktanella sp. S4079 TaxID=579483 RepID=UPI0005FA7E2C|nr:hypothetical protein [Loktanella sp. S4079]KJZ20118.1 hypothetical protein TW80_04580 [Loktanella sp. S4079]